MTQSARPRPCWAVRRSLAALLGGWIGVEIAKKWMKISHSTGDAFVFPLILGISIGRIGCFLTGLDDHTYGNFSSLPWAVNFGDGPRHPTQLYEIVMLWILGLLLLMRGRTHLQNGQLFRLFMLGYLLFRFGVEFIKPTYKPYLGLSAIQLACVAGMLLTGYQLIVTFPRRGKSGITESAKA